jgi:hypothetical protein
MQKPGVEENAGLLGRNGAVMGLANLDTADSLCPSELDRM